MLEIRKTCLAISKKLEKPCLLQENKHGYGNKIKKKHDNYEKITIFNKVKKITNTFLITIAKKCIILGI